MAKIKAHEFVSVDGVYESPSWTMEFPFDPTMGEAIGAVVGSCTGLLLGRNTFEMFAPAWSARSAEDDPGAVAGVHGGAERGGVQRVVVAGGGHRGGAGRARYAEQGLWLSRRTTQTMIVQRGPSSKACKN